MRLAEVMDDVADRLRSIAVFRSVWAYPPDAVTPPAAVVTYPDSYTPHAAYARGADMMVIPVVVVVGKVSERAARDRLSEFVDGSGPNSIIAILERGTYTAFDSLIVSNVEFDVVNVSDDDYLAAVFDCEIVGSGVAR